MGKLNSKVPQLQHPHDPFPTLERHLSTVLRRSRLVLCFVSEWARTYMQIAGTKIVASTCAKKHFWGKARFAAFEVDGPQTG